MPSAEFSSPDAQASVFRPDHRPQPRQAVALTDALARLEQAVVEIHGSEAFRRYLNAQAKFYRYVRLVLPKRA